jgi:Flp pilus assembly protein TadG
MSYRRKARSRGNSLIEFTLVGIPIIFLLISTFEMARGMWQYHTLAYAVRQGTRYAVVHGQNCTLPPNSCVVTISQISGVVRSAAIGLPSDALTLTFTPANGSATACTLNNCIANYTGTAWPPSSANAPGMKVKIAGSFPFKSAITMFWPGTRQLGKFKTVTLAANSKENILY